MILTVDEVDECGLINTPHHAHLAKKMKLIP